MERKIFNIACLFCILSVVAFAYSGEVANVPNPWTDCGRDFVCAQEISGIDFNVSLAEIDVRAMQDMVEIKTVDNDNQIVLRKSLPLADNQDNSGDYNQYKQTEPSAFNPNITLRKNDDLIYVMFFTENGYRYSLGCNKGLTIQQAQHYYNLMTDKL
ncbi:MAG: hypothetical protein IJ770_01670 [Alphaproteobacteria bacterium]|nr:hypothetical protein [Alphaproteobacteria bacterium]